MRQRIVNYYNQVPQREWNRLSQDAYHSIEFEISKRFIQKYLRQNVRVADVGGGPGRYSLWLLEQGCSVALVDPALDLLEIAKAEVSRSSKRENFLGAHVSSATDLKILETESFDLTLAFGPFYHLLEKDERTLAMREVARITKPGGYIFSATINRLCPFRDLLFGNTEEFVLEMKSNYHNLIRMLDEGVYLNHEENPDAFTDAYFAKVEEIPNLYKALGIELVEHFSCEGIASFLDERAELIKKDELAWNRFLDLLEKTATDSSLLGSGEHSVFIGRKLG